MSDLLARVRVMTTTFVTYAVLISSVVSGVVVKLQEYPDQPMAVKVAGWGVAALTWLAVAVSIARRVTEVGPAERGLLPPKTQNPEQQRFWSGWPR